jgi:hypothetical protein
MRTSTLSYLLLCAGLSAPLAWAEDIAAPDREKRQGMSYEEYTNFREKMRLRIKEKRDEKRNHSPETAPHSQEAKEERPHAARIYGQGFDSRNQGNDRPDIARPERPRVERFNRVERMRP